MKRIPPTHAALEQHVKRAVFQGGYVWVGGGGGIVPHPVLSSPSSWGWIRTDDEPHWTTLQEASNICIMS